MHLTGVKNMPDEKQEITQEVFDHLVGLGALELQGEESAYILRELNNQLAVIKELTAIEIPPGTAPASHGVPYTENSSQPLRRDAVEQCAEADAILAQVPKLEARYIIVPDTPHTTLE
jgi:aspartyl/glutamyl-tRNA(Asn/Gln) amidotransferase C subunit